MLSDLGAVLVDIEIPWAEEAFENNIAAVEAAWVHRDRLADPEVRTRIGGDTVSRLEAGRCDYAAGEYHGLMNRRHEIVSMAASMMEELDLIANSVSTRGRGAH